VKRSELIQSRTEVVSEVGVTAGGHMAEAEAGARILEQGGNAVDALVASAFAGFVVEPEMCSVAGYGRLAVHLPNGELWCVDHSGRVPRGATADMFDPDTSIPNTYYGWPYTKGRRNEWGHLSVPVPGAVAGLCAAHERWGTLPLQQVLEPAVELAEAGIPVTWNLAISIASRQEQLEQLRHAADLLLVDGRIPARYDETYRIDLSDLAKVLREIGSKGAAGFYEGWIAEAIDREMRENGGILTKADLAAYEPRVFREAPARFYGYDYITAFDQIGYEALSMLQLLDVGRYGPEAFETRHLMAEAIAHAFVDSMLWYGDPEHVAAPLNGLRSMEFAAERARGISLERAAGRPIEAADPWPFEMEVERPDTLPAGASSGGVSGTSQMAAADRSAMMCSLCTTVGPAFGSVVLVPGTGMFLTSAMQNYDPRPGRQNSIEPGKMPIFGVPEIVAAKDGKPVFGAAGSGNYRITTGVLHAMVNHLVFGLGLQEALDVPRVHSQGDQTQTFVSSRMDADTIERLRALGHDVVVQDEPPNSMRFGRTVAVSRDEKDGTLHAASYPAWITAAAGV
jgi:gamma-glutamyltranspeptidase/glutathione hydrolase